jgi:hypothetical protein
MDSILGKTISTLTQCKNHFLDDSVYKCHETMANIVTGQKFRKSIHITKIKPPPVSKNYFSGYRVYGEK